MCIIPVHDWSADTQFSNAYLVFDRVQKHLACALCTPQGALTLFWRVAVGVLGLLVFAVAYTEPTGKPVTRQAQEVQMLSIQSGSSTNEEQLAKTL